MKITIEYYGKTMSIDIPDGSTSTDVLEHMTNLLVLAGYHPNSINESLRELADERE
jgi:hypothetical protein